jgi:shikimate dehydrogenase
MGIPYAEVIGDPVEHSKSPVIHEYWLSQLGIPGEYRRTQVASADLADVLRQRRSDPDWRGCNVTVPHKEAVIPHLDRLDESARKVGAVNCIVPAADGLTGYNSDVDGVGAALDGVALSGGKAALIGAGGAARAALVYLASRGVAEVAVAARTAAKAAPLRSLLPQPRMLIGGFEDAQALFSGAAVVINASPLGMTGCPSMPDSLLAAVDKLADAARFDMVYSPLETPFLAAARGPRIHGLVMLVGQAARAFELFFGIPAPPADATLFDRLAA